MATIISLGQDARYRFHYSYSNGTDDFDYWDEMVTNDLYYNDPKAVCREVDFLIEKLHKCGNDFEDFVILDKQTQRVIHFCDYKIFKREVNGVPYDEVNALKEIIDFQECEKPGYFDPIDSDILKVRRTKAEKVFKEAANPYIKNFLREVIQLTYKIEEVQEAYEKVKED